LERGDPAPWAECDVSVPDSGWSVVASCAERGVASLAQPIVATRPARGSSRRILRVCPRRSRAATLYEPRRAVVSQSPEQPSHPPPSATIRLTATGLALGTEDVPLSAARVDYFRLSRGAWQPALEAVRALGARLVDVVVPWGVHETPSGELDF